MENKTASSLVLPLGKAPFDEMPLKLIYWRYPCMFLVYI